MHKISINRDSFISCETADQLARLTITIRSCEEESKNYKLRNVLTTLLLTCNVIIYK